MASQTVGCAEFGPDNPMTPVRVDANVIARLKYARRRFALEQEASRAQQQDPLCPFLIIPEIGRARLTRRYNALDPHICPREQHAHLLIGGLLNDVGKHVSREH